MFESGIAAEARIYWFLTSQLGCLQLQRVMDLTRVGPKTFSFYFFSVRRSATSQKVLGHQE